MASFSRGVVEVITSLMVVELNNVKQQILSWHMYLFFTPFGSSMCGVFGGLVPHMIL
jgi:hypothetical protein